MNRKFHRAGAAALGAILFGFSLGTAMSGAVAQNQAEPVEAEPAAVLEEAQPRFVASAVVQEIAEDETPAQQELVVRAESLRDLVSNFPADQELTGDMRCLAQAVYFESRGEPLDGQLAVAHVVINRAESSTFPDDYCSVVTQRAQFSFVRGGRIPEPNASTAAWSRARAIARIAHQELWDSEAGEALYFHATHVSPRWARRMENIARIDKHLFYK